jgi:hypothetical protein
MRKVLSIAFAFFVAGVATGILTFTRVRRSALGLSAPPAHR